MCTKTLCLVLWLVTAADCVRVSKLDLLGTTFKKNVNEVKSWPQIDLIFLVDASSSVGEDNFLSELRFVRKLLSDLTVSKEHTRVAVVTFGSQDSVVLHIDGITNDDETDKCTLLNDILPNIKYTGGGTYTLGAFHAARRIILDSTRTNTRKAVFLVTDGFSNGGDPNPVADQLKTEHNVTIFTIGIKTGRGDELQKLASNNETCYLLHGFKEFESLARRALHADLQDGEYVPVPVEKCGGLCDAKLADCACGTGSGQYACKCRRGYYGTGEQCQPCPRGTWHRRRDGICVPCPDPNHESFMALSAKDCKCKRGYKDNGRGRCEVVKCPEISAPANGYFVGVPAKAGKCPNVLHNACGVRCQVGYYLRGNSIRLCQENGTWTGVKPECEVKTCTKPPVPLKGKVLECVNKDLDTKYEGTRLPDDMPVDTECTFGCGEGHSVTGSTLRTCLPVAQWDGLKTTCKPIRCNRLGKIAHGHWIPDGCSKERQKFGARCTLVCKQGFVPSGDAITCKSTAGRGVGKWNPSGIKCIDREPPVIKCPAKSVEVQTAAGSQFGIARWESPHVTDNSGMDVTVWLEPSEEEDHAWNEFEIGTTMITYHAVDSFGNEAMCNMTVVVVDKEPPVIENCESPPPFLTADPTKVSIQWDEPLAYDNSKGPVEMSKSREFGIFETGTTEVTYTATDAYNNTNSCTIHITVVAEATCDNPPSETAICTPTHEGVTCALTCQEGYGFALTDRAVCLHDTPGIWDVPECTPTESPTDVWEVVNAEAECADNQTVETLGSIVREDGGIILLSGCQRRKRNIHEPKPMRRMEFRVKNTNKILQAADKVGVSATVGDPLITCKNGSVPAVRKNGLQTQCVKCPRGTYFVDKKCIPCPPDTFANKPGSLLCESCPAGRSTVGKKRAKGKRACKAQCPTGTSKSVKGNTCEGRPPKRLSCERPNVCKNGGTCIPVGTYRQKCACTMGWTGARCRVRVKACLCQNGGSCKDDGQCTCTPGFVGEYCELEESDLLPEEEEKEPKPEELSNPCRMVDGLCQNNGTCTVTSTGGFVCECVDGYIGRRCNVLPCDYNPCPLSSICVNIAEANATRNSYKCECPEGRYNPPECNALSDNCHSNPCLNGATCISQTDGFNCQCTEKFYGPRCEIEKDPDYVLHFPRSGINDFVIVDGPVTNLSEVSMCVWLQTADKGNYGTVLSYATDIHDNAFTVTDYSGLVLYVNGRHVVTDVRLNDGRWHHLCVTWNMSKGAYSVYVDSKLETSGLGLSDGTFISGHGKIVLGQEQDTLGGTFSRAESFIGKLSYVDIWSKVLTDTEVTATMHGCTAANIGNIRTWADFRNGTRGFVHVENSTFCGNCSVPNPIPNGQFKVAEDGRTATYKCEAGYDLFFEGSEVQDGLLTRQCTAASLWEGLRDPICVPVICPYPGYVPHARVTGVYHSYRYKDQLTYRCLPGFEPTEPQVRTCTQNGTWSGNRPVCRGGQCLPFVKPANSNVTVVSEHVYEEESFDDIVLFEIGTQLEISCAEGEQLQGDKLLSCQENGTWDHEVPKCQSPGCLANEMPSIPTNGYTINEISGVTFDTGTIIAFKCRNGHAPIGNNFTECLETGKWSSLSLVCKPIKCVSPPSYSNMHYKNGYNITEYFFGNMVKYECNEGYVFYGNNIARCLANGKWTKVKGQCTRISCKKPNVANDEIVIGTSYLYKDSLTVRCPKGSSNTEYMMKCTSTGKWLQIGDCQNAAEDPDDI